MLVIPNCNPNHFLDRSDLKYIFTDLQSTRKAVCKHA